MIAIVNYGSGNIRAISNILSRLGVPFVVAASPEELAGADRVILPGVGAFDQAMHELDTSGLRGALDRHAFERRAPILGICVGMQLLASGSDEGQARGLGWLDAQVRRFEHESIGQPIQLPHMGWNTVEPVRADPLFDGVDAANGYYFLHSYFFDCADSTDVLATTEYGVPFTSAVRRGNICGVQFHPEKSHANGVRLLENFVRL